MENNTTDCKRWYVMCTEPRKEFVVFDELISKGYEAALPVKEKIFATKKGVRKVKQAIISGYVFVCCRGIDLEKLRYTIGSTKFLRTNDRYEYLSQKDIDTLQRLCEQNIPVEITERLQVGEFIEIIGGVLNGTRGYISSLDNKRFITIQTEINFINLRIALDTFEYKKLEV